MHHSDVGFNKLHKVDGNVLAGSIATENFHESFSEVTWTSTAFWK